VGIGVNATNRDILPGVFELRPIIHRDSRGFFIETYHKRSSPTSALRMPSFKKPFAFYQGTLRGLHYQLRHPQAKLCRVVEGEALDVAVDIRVGSPTFGRWASVLLSAKEQNQVYVRLGCSRILNLTDTVHFCTNAATITNSRRAWHRWNDPNLEICWA